jgi:hypothetical protein
VRELNPSRFILSNPFEFASEAGRLTLFAVNVQAVMTMRILGMAGFWNTAPSENARMVREKQRAFAESAGALTGALMSGAYPLALMQSVTTPYESRVAANRKRLSRRGAKFFPH